MLSRFIAINLVVSATTFAPTSSGLSLRHMHDRRALTMLSEQRRPLTPVPLQTKAKPLLVPALSYAGLAGIALGAQHLAAHYFGGAETVMSLNVPAAGVVDVPVLVT